MALSKDYEIPNTGVTVPNAYFVIREVRLEKRLADYPYPGETYTDSERVSLGEPLVNFKAGRIAWITLSVYASQTARNNGSNPVGVVGKDNSKEYRCFIDGNSDISAQIYTYLKTETYFSDALDV